MAQQTYKIFKFVLSSLNGVINNTIGSSSKLAFLLNTQKPHRWWGFSYFTPSPKPVNNF